MKHKTVIAMICITILLAIALLKGINGALLTTGITAILALAGVAAYKAKRS